MWKLLFHFHSLEKVVTGEKGIVTKLDLKTTLIQSFSHQSINPSHNPSSPYIRQWETKDCGRSIARVSDVLRKRQEFENMYKPKIHT